MCICQSQSPDLSSPPYPLATVFVFYMYDSISVLKIIHFYFFFFLRLHISDGSNLESLPFKRHILNLAVWVMLNPMSGASVQHYPLS